MPTMTAPVAPVKSSRKPRSFTCSAELTINGTRYGVERISPGEDGSKAYLLHKADGNSYAVIRRHDGLIACDCPDHVCRREGLTATPCKHGRALVELGMMDAPAPKPLDGPQSDPGVETAPATVEAQQLASEPQSGPETDDYEPTAADLDEFRRWRDGDDIDAEAPALLTLDELIDHEADRYRMVGTLASELIARHLAELASLVRLVQAHTPHQAADRIATLERDRDRRD